MNILDNFLDKTEFNTITPHDLPHPLYNLSLVNKDAGELNSVLKNYNKLFNNALDHPERFANAGQNLTQDNISDFFRQNNGQILSSLILLGYDPVQLALSKKQHSFEHFLSGVNQISLDDDNFKLINKICSSKIFLSKIKLI
ncbi:MAG: hypothetical protein MZV64_26875 [Ignavibacteriales bacterium]|nr:hypothetical protein [Ignavibacteriales bacterium]